MRKEGEVHIYYVALEKPRPKVPCLQFTVSEGEICSGERFQGKGRCSTGPCVAGHIDDAEYVHRLIDDVNARRAVRQWRCRAASHASLAKISR